MLSCTTTRKTIMTEFQKWLRDQIENAGGKVRPFAARVGVSHSAVSDMLNKDVRPSLGTVVMLAKATGTPYTELIEMLYPELARSESEELAVILFRRLPKEKQELIRNLILSLIEQRGHQSHNSS